MGSNASIILIEKSCVIIIAHLHSAHSRKGANDRNGRTAANRPY